MCRSSRRLAHREQMREEAELMGHEVVEILHPVESQTYPPAMEELAAGRGTTGQTQAVQDG